jgi:transcriptional regulator with XRE-family HTH domain
MPPERDNLLGAYLRNRRGRLDPATFGLPPGRRRTPGLRREEVAQRANISPTWYTWLEQGRGGAPSADVLDRISAGMMLTEAEREHLFMLGLGRPPEPRYKAIEGITPRLQRILDSFEVAPAIIKTAIWDVVAWNRAAAALLTDYAKLPLKQRNIPRLIFSTSKMHALHEDWRSVARSVVVALRADSARANAGEEVKSLVEELSRTSPEFEAMWRESDVISNGDGGKRLHHPELGLLEMEYSAFSVDGRTDLGMIVYTPAKREDGERIRQYLSGLGGGTS